MEQQFQNLPTPESFEQLRLLAQRLLSPRFGPMGIHPDVTLLPGELPPELVSTVPLPPDTHIIGTMLITGGIPNRPFPHTTCIIDVPGDHASAFAHFATALPASGWQAEEMPQMGPPQGGFSGGMPWQSQQATYSHPSLDWLMIRAEGDKPDIVSLRLELSPSALVTQMRRALRHPNHFPQLPILPPMPGVTLWPNGASGGDNRQTSDAVLTGPVTTAAIQDFYRARLNESNWSPVEAAVAERTAWSTWTFADEEKAGWHGFLLIFQPYPDRHSWHLRLEATLDSDPFTGQSGFGPMMFGPR